MINIFFPATKYFFSHYFFSITLYKYSGRHMVKVDNFCQYLCNAWSFKYITGFIHWSNSCFRCAFLLLLYGRLNDGRYSLRTSCHCIGDIVTYLQRSDHYDHFWLSRYTIPWNRTCIPAQRASPLKPHPIVRVPFRGSFSHHPHVICPEHTKNGGRREGRGWNSLMGS